MTDDELKGALSQLNKSCHNGTSPMLLVFNAALTGIIANKDFHGPFFQGRPKEAVRFAIQVTREML